METNNLDNSPSSEPPRKIRKIAHSQFSTMAQAFNTFKPPRTTIIQRIQTTIVLTKDTVKARYQPLYQEVDKNLTIFNLDGCQFVAVNAPLTEISKWQTQNLPYQHFWVKNVSERRNAIVRAGIMLAGLHGLPSCAIGITVDPIACSRTESHYESLTELRRSIWHFILTKVQPIASHIKLFTEEKWMLNKIHPQTGVRLTKPEFTKTGDFIFDKFSISVLSNSQPFTLHKINITKS